METEVRGRKTRTATKIGMGQGKRVVVVHCLC